MSFSFLVLKKTAFSFLLFFLLSLSLLSGCSNVVVISEGNGGTVQFSITDNPSGKITSGRFIWHDLLTSQPKVAGDFYENLFGWKSEYQEQYAVVRNNGKKTAGIYTVQEKEGKFPAIWLPSISVENVDQAAKKVIAAGGKIIKGPVEMGKRGRAVLAQDNRNVDFVLLTAKGGDPAEMKAGVGDWLWDEIWSSDPDKSEEFYVSVLGYEEVESVNDDYRVLKGKGMWQGGIRTVGSDVKNQLWVPVVRVADPYAISERVVQLGGKVIVSPDKARNKGNVALIRDTVGALLLIQRWPSQSSDASDGGS